MSTSEAQATLEALRAKLAEASSREIALSVERRRLSFDANTGDAAAAKALDEANKATATLGLETENLVSAIDEAKRRLAAAERVEEMVAMRDRATEAQVLGEMLIERARKIDAALEIVAAELLGFVADITALNRLGASNPRAEQFTALGERALATALMPTPLKVRHLGHGEKRTFSELAKGWRDSVERWASAFVGNAEAA